MSEDASRVVYKVLEGLELTGGWKLGALRPENPNTTGSAFSLGFEAIGPNGARGFAKVLDLVRSSTPPDATRKLATATKAFEYEVSLLDMCGIHGARHVVHAMAADEVVFEGIPLDLVSFIVFEEAANDSRHFLDSGNADSYASRFRILHDAAVGLRELHSLRIAHQDVKPSNVLVFSDRATIDIAKMSDLGRASLDGAPALHDHQDVPGTPAYSAPELLYGQVSDDFEVRRIAADLYQFGCLVTFMIAQTGFNLEWTQLLPESHRWYKWAGSYGQIMPLVRNKMNEAMDIVEGRLPAPLAEAVMQIVRDLCDAEPRRRGAALRGQSSSSITMLNRLVTRLDLLQRQCERFGLKVA